MKDRYQDIAKHSLYKVRWKRHHFINLDLKSTIVFTVGAIAGALIGYFL